MNPATFLESFGHIADAPGGIDKLRALVLDLAVRGRLTHQDPEDEPASELLERIRAERERMVAAKEIRKPKEYPPLAEGDFSYELPSGWEWSRAVDLIYTVNGRAFKPTDWTATGRPIIRIQNLNRTDAPYNHYDGEVDPKFLIEPGDLLISWSGTPGTSFGAFVWQGPSGILNQHIFKCHIFEDYRDYICKAVNSRLDVLIDDAHGGVGLQHFTKDKLERLPLPVPPLAEQHRIVEKVDQLMVLCDNLEAQQTKRERTRIDFSTSTLRHLAEADSPDDLRCYLHLFADNIGRHLGPGSGDIAALKELRRTILDLAVRGRLTHQDPDDEPATELLDRIRAERERMVAAKEIRKPKPLQTINESEAPYELPEGWTWVRAGEFYLTSDSGWSPKCLTDPAEPGMWGVLKTSAVSTGRFDARENKALPPSLPPRPQIEVQSGDFVMIRASGSKSLVGMGAVVTDLDTHLMLSDKHIRLRFHSPISTSYWSLLNLSSDVQDHYSLESSGTSTMSNVTRDRIASMVVPVPPFAEQRRIVEQVDQLNALCDELEAQFLAAAAQRRDLASAVTHNAAQSTSTMGALA